MRRLFAFGILGIGGALAWQVGSTLSRDAIAMLLGIFVGLMVGLGATLLVLLVQRAGSSPPPPSAHLYTAERQAAPPIFILVAGQDALRLDAAPPPQLVQDVDAAWWAEERLGG